LIYNTLLKIKSILINAIKKYFLEKTAFVKLLLEKEEQKRLVEQNKVERLVCQKAITTTSARR